MGDNGRMTDPRAVDAAPENGLSDGADDSRSGGSRLYPRVTSFRSRRGALTEPQQSSWDRMWPSIGRDVADEPLDAASWFGRPAPVVLEIGSGTGTAALAMAAAEPHVNLIAVEVYRPGIAQTVQGIEREGLSNLRILRGDAADVLENMVAPGSLAGVRVFFPDPWPKARHHKRRLLKAETFALVANRLEPGGILHVATDHADYAEWIEEVGDAESALTRLPFDAERRTVEGSSLSVDRPVTKFEGKAQQVGRPTSEFVWSTPSTGATDVAAATITRRESENPLR
ncbi:tRNA (guanosine(46)-N7)-methyltransferase TrmB [Rhodococcus sp. BP-349]|nr:tRNA (guanosine(46)-N7)-methyltransferase TrmB [Rhodococcus sp. BP-363]MBY6544246.1 tRNA (guanosine(46)-N7)-methyltransferase TrmB [Rhodococcus sp. BP-369]MBY6563476.1 tRNA (guanosine(46)-N7)-methyltransferase TrmB [Rhodococcus sp. BP-370]MBY6577768.1 tRNA (guanosine(46)-N7)-methyltransferase TrmB [Rhodococcus sp. BP-364]MBY6587069.1 tRNA (guanosine(46)-N7)-methyltransferase TrmB [Rhodococcus sp. BP-358]MBY6591406.1 tRNA (guanosine(46)-N7)-methyltransferase TrmB [Rhodococcus sp. BP-362]MBY